MVFEFIYAIIVTFAHWLPTTPSSQSSIINCLGRNEVFFDFDYFTKGGFDRTRTYCDLKEYPMLQSTCKATIGFGFVVSSNILEAFLNTKVLLFMKSQTSRSASILSRAAFRRRQRDDGITITVTFWQWITEIVINLAFGIGAWITAGISRFFDHFIGTIFGVMTSVVLPCFYLMADQDFRTNLHQKGLYFALRSALSNSQI